MADYRFPCENCGGQLVFAPGQTSLTCPFCGHVQEIPEAPEEDRSEALREIDYRETVRRMERGAAFEETRVIACPTCGAQTEFPEGVKATTCPFCATPLVTAQTGTHRHVRPSALIPFALSEEEARAAMTRWLGSLWFAPNGLQDYARKGRRMDGVYVPYWTFDADTRTEYRGQRGDDYWVTRTVMRDGKPVQVRERRTRWRSVRGRVARFFDDVLVLASHSLPKAHTDALEPWDLRALEPYRPDYLSGFMAEGYSVGLEEGFAEARAIMDRVIQADIRRDIGGDHQRITQAVTQFGDVTFKHVLLPVWVAAYRFRGRSFRFVVNGQTGKVQGERPYSPWKIAFAVILGLIAAAVLAYLYAMAEGGGF
ncbi:primosomal protein N' (replication factor Y) - superfamily II helicase [Rubellimicrobium sp. CFH 75288]|uniref:primosomal protein N' (replication factor Y) - superfamily II helicase n=1 Tax=Rubellimicrobium sp. CFH 75288 TaxID=2697034 RepID=UPI0014127D8D|nr:primosomal protein N' (replication factor Y) - superfamily II helicase [Rubellimicrobium sp. CFH 75288]NAZ36535.1 primosomal protein N' (replication factor Y) - superfamily II helicase [Rubellimicrobium sp. CFH 75288]